MQRLKYSLNASTIRTTPVLKQIEVAAQAGYSAIELWHSDIDAHLARGGTLNEIRKSLSDNNLELPTTIYFKGWYLPDGPEYQAEMQQCRHKLDQAATLGARHVIASPPAGKVDYPLVARRYAEFLQLGLSYGVKPAMEYLGFVGELNHIDAAMKVMEMSGHKDATIILDPFHDARGGYGSEEMHKLKAHQIAISHFDDCPASPPFTQQRDEDRVMPGEGALNLKRYIELLRGTGYSGYLSLELFREDLWQRDPLEVAQIGLESMKEYCES